VAIRKLRKTLGSHGKWIVNIPKVGYTVSEEVEIESKGEGIHITAGDGHPFVGRQTELAKLKDLLAKSRLITLTGLRV
jgi:DNA-binding winged helix-turn-helix (wHTH) protein